MRITSRRWRHLVLAPLPVFAAAEQTVEEIIVRAPLATMPAASAASNVQIIDGEEILRQRTLDLTELMNRNLGSVLISEAQSNPLQPDVMYRGFVGSPLLGLPQGIAVYQDGVRINEPFGDTVNWALIPNNAIDSLQLLPGSDPLFGLNALGGAIAITTKSGFSHPGLRGELSGGSFGRIAGNIEVGASAADRLGWFASIAYLEEDGWRDFSGTRALQGFGSLSWQTAASTLQATLTLADTSLTGNGAAPAQLMAIDRESVFTHPDDTNNELIMLNVIGSHRLSDALSLAGNVYVRRSDIGSLNGDDSDYEACEDEPDFICDDDDPALNRDGNSIATNAGLVGATVNRTGTEQDALGLSAQLEYVAPIAGRANYFLAGASFDRGDIDFTSSTELGRLDRSRGAVGGGVYVGEADVALHTDSRNISAFFSDRLDLTDRLQLGIAGRFNGTDVTLHDRLGTALDGDHAFDRLNLTASLNYRRNDTTLYLRYSESSRVPSPVELTCADPADPCRLPNAFLSDPPLEMVVARSWEAGMRGSSEMLNWHAGAFHTLNEDDILFISAGALTNQGFFDNVGQTRRHGVELNFDGGLSDSVTWFAHYTWLAATFQDDFTVSSPNNPTAINGQISVQAGDRLPLIPEHLLKAGLAWAPIDSVLIGIDLQVNSDRHLRGDEGNDDTKMPGYAVINAYGSWQVSHRLRAFFNVNNLLDRNFETFGLYGEAEEVLGESFEDSRFLSPGAPRGAWVGIEFAIE